MADFTGHSSAYCGQVMHHRFRPKQHRFIYSVFSMLLDLDELPRLDQQLRGFSVNRFNLFSFHEKDHGDGSGNLKTHISELLESHGHPEACASIRMLCYPRILGYVFNPLSVYFCYDAEGQLRVVIYEVTNTFGERHSYVIEAEAGAKVLRQQSHKRMYVSPFTPEKSAYQFRIQPPGDRIAVCISQHSDNQRVLHATFTGQATPLASHRLLKLFFRYPLMTAKVIGAIHWEALRLWLKGVPVYRHTKNENYSLSWQDQDGVRHYEVL